MKQRLQHNWWKAVTEVGVSVIGSLGIVFIFSYLVASKPDDMAAHLKAVPKTGWEIFLSYFDGGQIGLSILSLSGAIYLLLNRLGKTHDFLGLVIYALFFLPLATAAFIVGFNPGFEPSKISFGQLSTLWSIYILVHFFWFILLLVQPHHSIPSAETSSKEELERTSGIEMRAKARG